MEAHEERPNHGRRKRRRAQGRPSPEPILIVARRPDSPLLLKPKRRQIAASATPRPEPRPPAESSSGPNGAGSGSGSGPGNGVLPFKREEPPPARREARIIRLSEPQANGAEKTRQRLLSDLLNCKGRIAISRAADNVLSNDIRMPREQEFQLQLLEHLDESKAREAIGVIADKLQKEPPLKKPVLDQRLRRLEEHGDDISTREAAATLRRALRL